MAFTSENQPDPEKKKRGRGKKSLMLEAIRATCEGGEDEFLKKVVRAALGDPSDGVEPNATLMNMVLQRIEPPLKANNECVTFEFNSKMKPHEQASQVLDAASKGLIAPDVASLFISSIQAMLKIQEVNDFDERLKALEADNEQD